MRTVFLPSFSVTDPAWSRSRRFLLLLGLLGMAHLTIPLQAAIEIILDGSKEGRQFDGIGGVSAGAASRLLIDYPEPQRREILDYLFKPGFGAAFQHLKVEIGGEINSTDGTEPTHMRTRDDENYGRGYEWWLMKEAKARHPDIVFDCLAWGAPGWIGDGNYYSQDMADYIVKFIQGAEAVHGLNIAYTGVRNELATNTTWIKTLRKTLDAAALGHIQIVADDAYNSWEFAKAFRADLELEAAVGVLGVHYPGFESSPEAKTANRPLWCTEEGPWCDDWNGARILARMLNRNYILGKMTKTEIWSIVTSYYDILALPNSGLLRAKEPWSGHYQVQPTLWAIAHTTQFAQPGWRYLEGNASRLLPNVGSIVTLKGWNQRDYSMVIETFDAIAPQTITFHLTNGLPEQSLHIWRTTETECFQEVARLTPVNGAFSYTVNPGCIYSITTTTNQSKGSTTPPPSKRFPLPYAENFDTYSVGATPRFFSDQTGSFEVAPNGNGAGAGLRQMVKQRGIEWGVREYWPYSIIGDLSWTDYEISANVERQGQGPTFLFGRIGLIPHFGEQISPGYRFVIDDPVGIWKLYNQSATLAAGFLPQPSITSYHMKLEMRGSSIRGWLNGALVADAVDAASYQGMAGLGSGWKIAQFDDFTIRRLHRSINRALGGRATARSDWDANYTAAAAIDGDFSTRWNSGYGTSNDQWLEIEFPTELDFNRTIAWQFDDRIISHEIQYWSGTNWTTIATGEQVHPIKVNAFRTVRSKKVRFHVKNARETSSVQEFQVFLDPSPAPSICINEWMIHNTATIADRADGDFEPWFEIWNRTATHINLEGYVLASSSGGRFSIPNGYNLGPGEHRLIWADGEPEQNQADRSELHVNFRLQEGGSIELYSPIGQQIDAIDLDPQADNTALGSKPDGDLAISALVTPSPGRAN